MHPKRNSLLSALWQRIVDASLHDRGAAGRAIIGLAVALTLTLCFAPPAKAQIVRDSVSMKSGGNVNVPSLTWSHTVGAGSNRLLIVGISFRDGNVMANAVTYGGTALTLIGAQTGPGSQNRTEMWLLLAPASGTADIVVTMSAAKQIVTGSISFTGVNQTTPLGTFASAQGMTGTATVTATSATNELVLDTVTANGDANSVTPAPAQTQQWNLSSFSPPSGGNSIGGGSTELGAASVMTTWALNTAKPWSIGAISIKPATPTAVKLSDFTASAFNDGVMLEWRSGFEANNLGYQLYRLENGQRTRVTPSLIAGSGLMRRGVFESGFAYGWFDTEGHVGDQYLLEAIDLNGETEYFAPLYALHWGNRNAPKQQRSLMLSEMSASNSGPTAERGWATPPESGKSAAEPAQTSSRAAALNTKASLIRQSLMDQQWIAALHCVKIQVRQDGWYRVTQPQLVAAGFDPAINVSKLHLYADGFETPMKIGGNDRTLGPSDAIEFYGVGRDELTTDTRTYYLVTGRQGGLRIDLRPQMDIPAPNAAGDFRYTQERKDRVVYLPGLLNGDESNIFGPPITASPASQTLTLRDVVHNGAQVQLEVSVQGLTAVAHQIQVRLNGTYVDTIQLSGATHQTTDFSVSDALLVEGDNTVTLTATGSSDISFVDLTRLTYARAYRAVNDALNFSVTGYSSAHVTGFSSSQLRVIDITNPNAPIELMSFVSLGDGGYGFDVNNPTSGPKNFIAFVDSLAAQPASIVANQPSTWSAANNAADMIILTHADFRDSIEPLATARRNQGMKVAVVDVEDVFDEFSYGAHRPVAIRDFLQWATTHWQKAPQYLLLVGHSSWDPRNFMGQGNSDFVPTKLLDTAELETASDDWLADFDDDGIPELAVGRLPAHTAGEASTMVSKILSYEQSLGTNRGALLVSDRGFEDQTSQVGSIVSSVMTVQTLSRSAVNNDSLMQTEIVNAIDQGPQIVNYFGHGSVTVWTGAGLLNQNNAATLTNGNRLSLFVMMTCLNSYSHDAYIDSLAEILLKDTKGGAVATWSSSGETEPEGQASMNQQLYQLLLSNPSMTLGQAIRNAKMASPDIDVRRTWQLLGDPSMKLFQVPPAAPRVIPAGNRQPLTGVTINQSRKQRLVERIRHSQ